MAVNHMDKSSVAVVAVSVDGRYFLLCFLAEVYYNTVTCRSDYYSCCCLCCSRCGCAIDSELSFAVVA